MQLPDLTNGQFFTLRSLITLARETQVRRLSELRTLMIEKGEEIEDVDAAILFWGEHLRQTYKDAPALLDSLEIDRREARRFLNKQDEDFAPSP